MVEQDLKIIRARSAMLLLAVGVSAVAVMLAVGFLAGMIGGDGALIGIPFGQALVAAALYFSTRLGLPKIHWGRAVFRGVFAGAMALFFAAGVTWAWNSLFAHLGVELSPQPMLERLGAADPAEFAFITIVAGFWGPFVEEVYFRGWWQSFLLDFFNRKGNTGRVGVSAILVVASVFALLHWNLSVFPGLLVAGLCFGLTAQRWGLASAVAAHVVFNVATIIAERSGMF